MWLKLGSLRDYFYFISTLLLILNVFDFGFSNFLILKYGIKLERNPFVRFQFASWGLTVSAFLKLVPLSFAIFFSWFLIERIHNSKGVLFVNLFYILIVGLYIKEVLNQIQWIY